MNKRYHALHELLSSERAYASDLALIRELHIPLALGQTVSLPTSSASDSSRSLSTASDSSLGPPMSPEDAKTIFGNISELAIFADALGQELESALGALVEGGQGPDSVGSLFLEIAPDLEGPYKQYITRHPSALQHLQSLPQTPALTAYLSHTQTVASSVSHAWDLSSLLIKPVQRLLKYPLLLSAIIDETPDDHPDKDNLRNARIKLEEIARNVNEERRRAEVVKDVLMSKKSPKSAAGVGVAAQVNLSKMKSLRHGGVTAATMRAAALAEAADSSSSSSSAAAAAANAAVAGGGRVAGATGSAEAVLVEQMQNELRRIELFAQQFAKNVVDWSKMMSHVMVALRVWTLNFGKVIGLAQDQGFGSEAFDAFLDVVEKQLMPLAVELEGMINERLLKDMAHLLTTMHKPLKLLASMNDQEPYHYHLLTMPVSAKNRPPPSLLAASTNYLALRGQLAAELPTYLRLLHRGFDGFVLRLAEIQMRFWGHVRERWGVLWEMLRVEGELNAGWEETVDVWRMRWGDVDVVMKSVGILKPGRGVSLDGQFRRKSADREHGVTPAALYQQQYQQQQQQQQHYSPRSSASSIMKSPKVGNVQAVIASLEPMHSPTRRRGSSPVPTARSRGGSDTYSHAGSFSTEYANGTSSIRGGGGGGRRKGSSQDRNRDGKRRSQGQLQQQIQSLQQQLYQLQQPQQFRDMERHSIDLEDDYVSVGTGSPPPYESRGGGRQGIQRMKSMPLHAQSQSQSHNIHPYPIPNPNSRPNLNTKSSLNSDKSSLLTISTSTSTTTTTATFTGTTTTTTTTMGASLACTSRDSGDTEGRRGLNAMYRTEDAEYTQYFDAYAQCLESRDKERAREKELELERGKEKERGRRPLAPPTTTPPSTPPTKLTKERPQSSSSSPMINNPKRKSKERPTHIRNRSGSVKSITSFFTSSLTGSSSSQPLPSTPPNSSFLPSSNSTASSSSSDQPPRTPPPQFRDSWCTKPAKYVCRVIHPCTPPSSVSYYSFPFFTLREGELLGVLQEAGHPSIHPKLPLWVDDGEDCLLLCREEKGGEGEGVSGGNVGWALASFLEPLSSEDG